MSPLPLGYTAPLMSATKVRIFFEFSISCEDIEEYFSLTRNLPCRAENALSPFAAVMETGPTYILQGQERNLGKNFSCGKF